MRKLPGWPLVAVAVAMIAIVAATVFRTVEIDNAVAYLFIGAALIMVGAWLTLVIYDYKDHVLEQMPKKEEQP